MDFVNSSKINEKSSPVERYLNHLDSIFQKEPVFSKNESTIKGLPGVTAIVYEDIPEKGFITGLTFGLSIVEHPQWKFSRPELCLTVESSDIKWGHVAAFLANQLRGDCPFCYGDAINFREKISSESEMDAFFVFAPSILNKENYLNIDIGTNYKISISGLYPMYSDELEVFDKIGLEAFWHHPNFDMYDVNRKRIK